MKRFWGGGLFKYTPLFYYKTIQFVATAGFKRTQSTISRRLRVFNRGITV